jgi:outer membrane protein TolC
MIRYPFITIIFLCCVFHLTNAQVRTLDYFLQQGISNSPLLKDLNNQIRLNSIDSLLIKARQKPQVNFDGMLYYAPIINGYGYSEAVTNNANLSSLLGVSQNIFNSKTLEARYLNIGIQNQALSNSSRITENDLKKAITTQYLITYSLLNEINLARSLVVSMHDEEKLIKQLVGEGIYKQTEFLSFLVEMQSQELELNDMQIQYRKELSVLNMLSGISDKTMYDLSKPEITLIEPLQPEMSPFFLRFKYDSLLIQNERLLIDRNYKPVVKWFSDAGILSNDPAVIYKNFGLSVGLSLSLPVFDGHQRNLNYEKLNTSEETRRNYQNYFSMQYDRQLEQMNEELRKTREMMPQLSGQLNLAGSIILQSKELINIGSMSITDYLIAIRNYMAIQKNLNRYEIKMLQIINEINYWR